MFLTENRKPAPLRFLCNLSPRIMPSQRHVCLREGAQARPEGGEGSRVNPAKCRSVASGARGAGSGHVSPSSWGLCSSTCRYLYGTWRLQDGLHTAPWAARQAVEPLCASSGQLGVRCLSAWKAVSEPHQIFVTKLLGCWFLMVHNQAFSNGRSLLGRIEATSLGDTQEVKPSVTCTLPRPPPIALD